MLAHMRRCCSAVLDRQSLPSVSAWAATMRLAAAPVTSGGAEGGGPQALVALRAVHMLMAWADRQAASSSQVTAQPLKPAGRGGIRPQQHRRCPVAVICSVQSLKAQRHGKVGVTRVIPGNQVQASCGKVLHT